MTAHLGIMCPKTLEEGMCRLFRKKDSVGSYLLFRGFCLVFANLYANKCHQRKRIDFNRCPR